MYGVEGYTAFARVRVDITVSLQLLVLYPFELLLFEHEIAEQVELGVSRAKSGKSLQDEELD